MRVCWRGVETTCLASAGQLRNLAPRNRAVVCRWRGDSGACLRRPGGHFKSSARCRRQRSESPGALQRNRPACARQQRGSSKAIRADSALLPRSSVGTLNSRSRRLAVTAAPSVLNSRLMPKGCPLGAGRRREYQSSAPQVNGSANFRSAAGAVSHLAALGARKLPCTLDLGGAQIQRLRWACGSGSGHAHRGFGTAGVDLRGQSSAAKRALDLATGKGGRHLGARSPDASIVLRPGRALGHLGRLQSGMPAHQSRP